MATKTGTSNISVKWSKYGLEAVISVTASKTSRSLLNIDLNDMAEASDGGAPYCPRETYRSSSGTMSEAFAINLSDDIGTSQSEFLEMYESGELTLSCTSSSVYFYILDGVLLLVLYDNKALLPTKVEDATLTATIDGVSGTYKFRIPPYGLALANVNIALTSYEKLNTDDYGTETYILNTGTSYKTNLCDIIEGLTEKLAQDFYNTQTLRNSFSGYGYGGSFSFDGVSVTGSSDGVCPIAAEGASSSGSSYVNTRIATTIQIYWGFGYTTSLATINLFSVTMTRITRLLASSDTGSSSNAILYNTSLYYVYVSNETNYDYQPKITVYSQPATAASSSSAFTYSRPSAAPSYCGLGLAVRVRNDTVDDVLMAAYLGFITFVVRIQGPGTTVFQTFGPFGTAYSNSAYDDSNHNKVLPMFILPQYPSGNSYNLSTNSSSTGTATYTYLLLAVTSYYEFASGQPGSPYQWTVRITNYSGSTVDAATLYMSNSTTASWFGP